MRAVIVAEVAGWQIDCNAAYRRLPATSSITDYQAQMSLTAVQKALIMAPLQAAIGCSNLVGHVAEFARIHTSPEPWIQSDSLSDK
jgi:hypothetical protein